MMSLISFNNQWDSNESEQIDLIDLHPIDLCMEDVLAVKYCDLRIPQSYVPRVTVVFL